MRSKLEVKNEEEIAKQFSLHSLVDLVPYFDVFPCLKVAFTSITAIFGLSGTEAFRIKNCPSLHSL